MRTSRQLRLVRLVCLARLRQLGIAPWVLLMAWLAWAALQEPELLRRSEIYITEGAAWWGGAALLMAFASSEAAAATPPSTRLLCNLLAAIAMSALLFAVLFGADLATASVSERLGGMWLRMIVCFTVATWAVAALQNMSQSYYWYAFAALQAIVFIGLSVTLAASSTSPTALLASGLVASASVLLTMRDPRPDYAEAK
jgi:hypothetical protein